MLLTFLFHRVKKVLDILTTPIISPHLRWQSKFLGYFFMLIYVNYPSLITRPFHSSVASSFLVFSITAVGVLDRQSLEDRFQTPIFFSTIAIEGLIFNCLLDHSNHHSQSAIDNLNYSDRHFQPPIDRPNDSDRSPVVNLYHFWLIWPPIDSIICYHYQSEHDCGHDRHRHYHSRQHQHDIHRGE